MPNWVSVQAFLSGPRDEVERFRHTCIHQMPDTEAEEIGFDFESLIPMPDQIEPSLEALSERASLLQKLIPGMSNERCWREASWGVKWNASAFQEIEAAPGYFAFAFEVPWSFPYPIFMALAQQFPRLSGEVSAIEWNMRWIALGLLSGGDFCVVTTDITRETAFLAETSLCPALREATARALNEFRETERARFWTWSTTEDAPSEKLWGRICAHLRPELAQQLNFAFDVERYRAWHENDDLWFEDEDDSRPLEEIIQRTENLRFLQSNGRCYFKLDRKLMALIAAHFRTHHEATATDEDLEQKFRLSVAYLLLETSEDELWEWAAHAAFRLCPLNLADLSTLQTSFVDYASRLRQETIRFLMGDTLPTSIAA